MVLPQDDEQMSPSAVAGADSQTATPG